MSEGNLFKPDKDYTKDVDDLLPKAEELAKARFQDSFFGGSVTKLT